MPTEIINTSHKYFCNNTSKHFPMFLQDGSSKYSSEINWTQIIHRKKKP